MKFSYHHENIKHINKLDPLKIKAHVQSASVLTEC